MNILNLLTENRRVAGVEINEQTIRLAFFQQVKKNRELVLVEESIPAGIIKNGAVVDPLLLGNILKKIWSKADFKTDFTIVSIPSDKIYSRIFSFPGNIDKARLTEAMHLAIDFQLPVKNEEVYLDWEHTENTPLVKEILLSTIPREISDGYLTALNYAGITMMALESHLTSIARAIKAEPGQAVLVTKETTENTTVFIIKDSTLRFSLILPLQFLPKEKLNSEIKRIKTSFEAENNKPILETSLSEASIRNEYFIPQLTNYPKEDITKWLVSIGAAIRGQIPKGEDHLISLLPINTQKAYAFQKINTFIVLLRNMTIGISIFFVVAFSLSYLLIITLSQYASHTVVIVPSSSLPPDLLQKKSIIEQVNSLTSIGQTLLSDTVVWSTIIDEIKARTINGITISRFSAPSITEKMSLAGTAQDRDTINQFKKSMQESAMFTEIDLPITNLDKRTDIPFSISFIIKDPSTVYYK